MAFSRDGWQPIGGQSKRGKAPMMWSYTTTDALATVNTANYFNSVNAEVKVGDLIYVHDSNTPTASLVVVLSNDGTNVDVSDGTALSVADAD
tara:strand:- start:1023 stop:1298 length:276 start_codon:yes stop_codon:yes gene_type:complete